MKRHLILLRLALDLYATTSEEQDAAAPKPPGSVPEDDELAQLLGRRITMSMARTDLDPLALRPKLDGLIERIRTMRAYGAEMWWQELARPVTVNELSVHFSGIWFSDLSLVQAAAATVLRYLQAETWIERMVAEPMPDADRALVRDQPAMSRFDAGAFDIGLIERAKDLLFLYRREVLRDKMAPKTESTLSIRAKNAGTDPIAIAMRVCRSDQPPRNLKSVTVIAEAGVMRPRIRERLNAHTLMGIHRQRNAFDVSQFTRKAGLHDRSSRRAV